MIKADENSLKQFLRNNQPTQPTPQQPNAPAQPQQPQGALDGLNMPQARTWLSDARGMLEEFNKLSENPIVQKFFDKGVAQKSERAGIRKDLINASGGQPSEYVSDTPTNPPPKKKVGKQWEDETPPAQEPKEPVVAKSELPKLFYKSIVGYLENVATVDEKATVADLVTQLRENKDSFIEQLEAVMFASEETEEEPIEEKKTDD